MTLASCVLQAQVKPSSKRESQEVPVPTPSRPTVSAAALTSAYQDALARYTDLLAAFQQGHLAAIPDPPPPLPESLRGPVLPALPRDDHAPVVTPALAAPASLNSPIRQVMLLDWLVS